MGKNTAAQSRLEEGTQLIEKVRADKTDNNAKMAALLNTIIAEVSTLAVLSGKSLKMLNEAHEILAQYRRSLEAQAEFDQKPEAECYVGHLPGYKRT